MERSMVGLHAKKRDRKSFRTKESNRKKWKLKEEEKKSAHDTQNTWRKAFLPHKRNENLHEIGVFCWR
jgi:hypothetical protein